MNKFAEITVIEFKNGKTAETFDSDEDFRTGIFGRELAGKVRVTWDDNGTVEWVKSDMLHKLDKSNVELIRPETDIQDKPQYERQIPPMAHIDANGVSTDIQPPKARKPRTAAKQAEA